MRLHKLPHKELIAALWNFRKGNLPHFVRLQSLNLIRTDYRGYGLGIW